MAKTFSFLDCESKDLLKYENGHTVRIQAEDHADANYQLIELGLCDDCVNWTNTGTKAWCWEDME